MVERDGMGHAVKSDNLARTVRQERARARRFLHELSVLPWAAFDAGTLPRDWWRTTAFKDSLAEWDSDAYRLWWRASREEGPPVDIDREAAGLLRHDAFRRWAGSDKRPVIFIDPIVRAAAKGRLVDSARASTGTMSDWLASLIGFAGQTEECIAGLVADADSRGELDELREAWLVAQEVSS